MQANQIAGAIADCATRFIEKPQVVLGLQCGADQLCGR